jgi:osmotically-inducible protein OsmY
MLVDARTGKLRTRSLFASIDNVGRLREGAFSRLSPLYLPPQMWQKAFMKTDIELQSDVLEELRWEPAVAFAGITVLAKDGVVTLTGTVPFFAEKLAAERATRRVKGVKAIVEELSVRVLEYHNHKDTDIAESVANALKWHVWVPDSVQATVEKGWVSLNGQVKWQYQRNAAEDAVRYCPAWLEFQTRSLLIPVLSRPTYVPQLRVP